jgi:hypothetical protein
MSLRLRLGDEDPSYFTESINNPECKAGGAFEEALAGLRHANTARSAPCLTVKFCFIPRAHYRE